MLIRLASSLLLALLTWSTGDVANAQSIDLLGSSNRAGADTLLERKTIEQAVETSFVRTLDTMTRRTLDEGQIAADDAATQRLQATARQEFLDALTRRLDELESDGLLTFVEVTRALPSLRGEHMARYRRVLTAASAGVAAPPDADDYDSRWRYHRDTAHYVFTVRNSLVDWSLLALSVLAGVVLAMLVSYWLKASAIRLDSRQQFSTAHVIAVIRTPLLLTAGTLGLLAGLQFLWLPAGTGERLATVLEMSIVLYAFWMCWSLSHNIAGVLARLWQRTADVQLEGQGRLVIQRLLRLATLIGLVLIITKLILDASVTGLIAGLGVLGVGLWFLLQGLVANLAASFTLFGDPPFKIGDTVVFDDHWGHIEDIGFRSTRFRTLDGHLLTIPNQQLIDEAVHNVSAQRWFRRRFRIGLVYETSADTLEQAIGIVHDILEQYAEHLCQEHDSHVVFSEFGAHDLQLLIEYHVDTRKYWEAQQFHDRFNREMLKRFNAAGIRFAFPTRTLHVETDPAASATVGRVMGEDADDQSASNDSHDVDRGEARSA